MTHEILISGVLAAVISAASLMMLDAHPRAVGSGMLVSLVLAMIIRAVLS